MVLMSETDATGHRVLEGQNRFWKSPFFRRFPAYQGHAPRFREPDRSRGASGPSCLGGACAGGPVPGSLGCHAGTKGRGRPLLSLCCRLNPRKRNVKAPQHQPKLVGPAPAWSVLFFFVACEQNPHTNMASLARQQAQIRAAIAADARPRTTVAGATVLPVARGANGAGYVYLDTFLRPARNKTVVGSVLPAQIVSSLPASCGRHEVPSVLELACQRFWDRAMKEWKVASPPRTCPPLGALESVPSRVVCTAAAAWGSPWSEQIVSTGQDDKQLTAG